MEGIIRPSAVPSVPAVASVVSKGPFPRSTVSLGVVPVVGRVVSAGAVVGCVVGTVVAGLVGAVVSIGLFPRQPVRRDKQSTRLSPRNKAFFIFITSE
jgi:hypothetical protein